MRRVGCFIVGLLALGAIGCGSDAEPKATEPENPLFGDGVLVIAHGGAQAVTPPETLLAYQTAIEAGADVLEGDLHATSDGVLVLIHDATIDATTNGTGAVKDMTFADLQQWDAGYRFTRDGGQTFPYRGQGLTVPSLESVLDAHPDAYFVLEIKQESPSIVTPFIELLEQRGLLPRVIIASFWDAVIDQVRERAPDALTSLATAEMVELVALGPDAEASYVPPGRFVQPPATSAQPALIERVHRLDMKIHPWTVNDPAEMQELIDLGVDGIITDDPAALRALL
jgi:glycerophosphoryl diester phosphodiesterase